MKRKQYSAEFKQMLFEKMRAGVRKSSQKQLLFNF